MLNAKACQPELDLQNPHDSRREGTTESCFIQSLHPCHDTHAHVYTQVGGAEEIVQPLGVLVAFAEDSGSIYP